MPSFWLCHVEDHCSRNRPYMHIQSAYLCVVVTFQQWSTAIRRMWCHFLQKASHFRRLLKSLSRRLLICFGARAASFSSSMYFIYLTRTLRNFGQPRELGHPLVGIWDPLDLPRRTLASCTPVGVADSCTLLDHNGLRSLPARALVRICCCSVALLLLK